MTKPRFISLMILLAAAELFAIDIPQGTKITVRTSTMVTSDRSLLGDPVDPRLDHDLRIGRQLIAPEGAVVRGFVASSTPSQRGKNGYPGSVSIRLETIETPEGTYHLTTNTFTRQGTGRYRTPVPGARVGGGVPIGGGISVDSVGGVQRESPFPQPDASGVAISGGGPEAIIPEESIITFRTITGSKPIPKK